MRFSIVVPVYNRPEELLELLESLALQTYTDFEVIIIEDGSTLKSDKICKGFEQKLKLKYQFTPNQGQGFARNTGSQLASGEYLIFFDSDVVVPREYLSEVNSYLLSNHLDAYGGEDRASKDFSSLQKAISYSMTSFLTTGGIRSKNNSAVGSYQIRSYNLGIKRKLFEDIGGFSKTNMGEDMELNARLTNLSIKKSLIPEAYVFHKRRNSFSSFFRQIFSFGRTRIQLKRDYSIPIKPAHLLPVAFVFFVFSIIVASFFSLKFGSVLAVLLLSYLTINALIAAVQNNSIAVGILVFPIVFIQHSAYGLGFISEFLLKGKR